MQILAPEDDLPFHPTRFENKHGIRAVSLGDLISMKLGSGTKYVHRSQDVADVVRIIAMLKLDKSFTGRITADYRADFRRLVDAVQRGM